MDEIINAAKELRNDIDNLPEVQEYYRLKNLYENDIELKEMRTKIALLKQQGKEEERNNLFKLYNSHPLVNNYESAKEEVQNLLRTIKDIIE